MFWTKFPQIGVFQSEKGKVNIPPNSASSKYSVGTTFHSKHTIFGGVKFNQNWYFQYKTERENIFIWFNMFELI